MATFGTTAFVAGNTLTATALDTLRRYTNPSPYGGIGLVYYVCQSCSSYYQPRPDVRLNAYGLALVRRLGRSLPSPLPSAWRAALESGLAQQARDARRYQNGGRYGDFETLAYVRFAVGGDFELDASRYSDVAADFTFSRLAASATSLSSRGRVLIGLQRALDGAFADDASVSAAVAIVRNQLRVQGRTAYVAVAADATSADATLSALGLWLLVKANLIQDEPLAEKLANYVGELAAGASTSVYSRASGEQLLWAASALRAYDEAVGNTSVRRARALTVALVASQAASVPCRPPTHTCTPRFLSHSHTSRASRSRISPSPPCTRT